MRRAKLRFQHKWNTRKRALCMAHLLKRLIAQGMSSLIAVIKLTHSTNEWGIEAGRATKHGQTQRRLTPGEVLEFQRFLLELHDLLSSPAFHCSGFDIMCFIFLSSLHDFTQEKSWGSIRGASWFSHQKSQSRVEQAAKSSFSATSRRLN